MRFEDAQERRCSVSDVRDRIVREYGHRGAICPIVFSVAAVARTQSDFSSVGRYQRQAQVVIECVREVNRDPDPLQQQIHVCHPHPGFCRAQVGNGNRDRRGRVSNGGADARHRRLELERKIKTDLVRAANLQQEMRRGATIEQLRSADAESRQVRGGAAGRQIRETPRQRIHRDARRRACENRRNARHDLGGRQGDVLERNRQVHTLVGVKATVVVAIRQLHRSQRQTRSGFKRLVGHDNAGTGIGIHPRSFDVQSRRTQKGAHFRR